MVHKSQNEHQISFRNRMIGAFVWFGILMFIVPDWYTHPVNFNPNPGISTVSKEVKASTPLNINTAKKPDLVNKLKQKILPNQIQDGEWQIKVKSYTDKKTATEISKRLNYDYKSSVIFSKITQRYMVIVGPIDSYVLALETQQKINKLLRIKTKLAKIK